MEISSPIFISHASEDEAEVKKIESWLSELGLNPWVSYNDIHRLDYHETIASAIENCGCLLLILSQTSITKPYVLKEINFAAEIAKKIFIYQLEDEVVIPPGILLAMGPVHKILSTKFPDDCLERLARQLLNEAGFAEADARHLIRDAQLSHRAKIAEIEKQYRMNLQTWKDEYLDSRWQSGKFRDRPSKLDIETLNDRARELGLDLKDIEQICSLTRNKESKKQFIRILDSALRKKTLTYQNLYTIEKRRLASMISRAEAKEVIERRTSAPVLTGKNKAPADESLSISWLIDLLMTKSNDDSDGYIERSDPRPSHSTRLPKKASEESALFCSVTNEELAQVRSMDCGGISKTSVDEQESQRKLLENIEKSELSPDKKNVLQSRGPIPEGKSETDALNIVLGGLFLLLMLGVAKVCVDIFWFLLKRGMGLH